MIFFKNETYSISDKFIVIPSRLEIKNLPEIAMND